MMQPTEQATQCFDQMAIVEKYERVIAYLYPIAQSMPRKHGVAREMFLQCLLGIPDLLFQAGKSNQVSKIYAADAGLAQVRFWLRFLLSIYAMTTHKLLRKDSVLRAKRKVANFMHHGDMHGLQKFAASWAGHAQWADAHNLFKWMEQRYEITF